MKNTLLALISPLLTLVSCNSYNTFYEDKVVIPDFRLPQTVQFESNLSNYNIYEGNPVDLIPSDDFYLLELSSTLFTDYAQKQRLVKLPSGTEITRINNEQVDFPDMTILVKTFFYYNDEADPDMGKRIIETRLLIKEKGIWNAATYLWDEEQQDAVLELDGFSTQVDWKDYDGNKLSTLYKVPSSNECVTCHQSNSTLTPLGPTLRNLNRIVDRNESMVNQLTHLQSEGLLNHFPVEGISQIVDYKDTTASLKERGKAYFAMNCAHCHNPSGWEKANRRPFDFRYETPG